MPSPYRSHAHTLSDKMVVKLASMCATADLELDEVAPDAKAMIQANAVDRKVLADLMADLLAFRRNGRRNCRIGMSGGKLVALPLA